MIDFRSFCIETNYICLEIFLFYFNYFILLPLFLKKQSALQQFYK